MSFKTLLQTLPEEVEDIIYDYERQLNKITFSKVLEELTQGFISYDPLNVLAKIADISDRMPTITTTEEYTEILEAINELKNPFKNIPHKKETLSENKVRWEKALIRHREYFNNITRCEVDDQEDMYYWSQLLVYKYGHQGLSGFDYDIRGEDAFGC